LQVLGRQGRHRRDRLRGPKRKTVRRGMSVSAHNKCVDTLKAIFEIAREEGVI
jgi:hypothetical protein